MSKEKKYLVDTVLMSWKIEILPFSNSAYLLCNLYALRPGQMSNLKIVKSSSKGLNFYITMTPINHVLVLRYLREKMKFTNV
jgi:hypothetical protein